MKVYGTARKNDVMIAKRHTTLRSLALQSLKVFFPIDIFLLFYSTIVYSLISNPQYENKIKIKIFAVYFRSSKVT